jgi:hypothetical protein
VSRETLRRWRAACGAAVALVATVPALAAQPAGAATRPATVNVVHGIPGVAVNVCVNGTAALEDFRYGEAATGVDLPAGSYRVRVVAADKGCRSAALLKERYQLRAGRSYTVVAALRPSGKPALPAFTNKVRPSPEGTARLTVRHTAAAPAVNVWAGRTRLIGGKRFTWGDEKTLAVPAGRYRVKVTLPGSRQPVIGPQRLTLRPGRAYQVHAVGTGDRYRLVVVKTRVGTH